MLSENSSGQRPHLAPCWRIVYQSIAIDQSIQNYLPTRVGVEPTVTYERLGQMGTVITLEDLE